LHGRVGLDNFTQEEIHNPAVRQLMSTVVLHRDPELDRVYPDKWPAVVTIETTQGIRHEARVDFPKGDPKNPMTPEELIAKFHALTGRTVPEPSRSLLIERCLTLEKLDNARLLFKGIDLA
ncbi:MAG: MmgE/PrpD family protein, partial [Candidatus Methylomirabilales bacterium]